MADVARDLAFISYHRKDRPWLKRLVLHLEPVLRSQALAHWNDTLVQAGDTLAVEADSALQRACVVLLLVSADYLGSPELDRMLTAARAQQALLLWLPVRPSAYEQTELAAIKPLLDPKRPLAGRPKEEAEQALVEVCERVTKAMLATGPGGNTAAGADLELASGSAGAAKPVARALLGSLLTLGAIGLGVLGTLWLKLTPASSRPESVDLQHSLSGLAAPARKENQDVTTPPPTKPAADVAPQKEAPLPPRPGTATLRPKAPLRVAGDEDERVVIERNGAFVVAGRVQRDSRGNLLFQTVLPEGMYTIRCHSGQRQLKAISLRENNYVQCK